jgi:hypothetical protein
MKKMNFNIFCHHDCDGLYEPRLSDYAQCTGYFLLKKMVVDKITPASLSEIKRWETNPTSDELVSVPDIKYLRFLHPLLRPYIIEHWPVIKEMEIDYL